MDEKHIFTLRARDNIYSTAAAAESAREQGELFNVMEKMEILFFSVFVTSTKYIIFSIATNDVITLVCIPLFIIHNISYLHQMLCQYFPCRIDDDDYDEDNGNDNDDDDDDDWIELRVGLKWRGVKISPRILYHQPLVAFVSATTPAHNILIISDKMWH